MSLLSEIQESAVTSDVPIATILRKCLVLASRYRSAEFRDWVARELDGYPEAEEPPSYRVIPVSSFGHFVGGFGRELRNAPFPVSSLPEKLRDNYANCKMRQPISSYAELLRETPGKNMIVHWPPELLMLHGTSIYVGFNCIQAWQEVPRSAVMGVLDTVRNRVLRLSLELEESVPEVSKIDVPTQEISRQVTQQFHTYVLGNVGQITAAGSITQQLEIVNVSPGDLDAVLRQVRVLGASDVDILELKEAIEADGQPGATKTLGARVTAWLANASKKSAAGAWKLVSEAAPDVLAAAVKSYYGI